MTRDTRSFPFSLIIVDTTHLCCKHTKMRDFSPVNTVLQLNAWTFSEGWPLGKVLSDKASLFLSFFFFGNPN